MKRNFCLTEQLPELNVYTQVFADFLLLPMYDGEIDEQPEYRRFDFYEVRLDYSLN